jgi:hypothetical protein
MGWPFTAQAPLLSGPVFGADGTSYLNVTAWPGWGADGRPVTYARVAALDPSGAMRSGWPIEFGRGDVRGILPRDDGSVAIVTCTPRGAGGAAEACHVHLLAADGRERPGWPVEERTATECLAPLAGPAGAIYLVCSGPGERTTLQVSAFDPTGAPRQGSPAMFETSGYAPPEPRIAPDGMLYFMTMTADQVPHLNALDAGFVERDGWPFIGAGAQDDPYRGFGYVLGPDGTPYAWWYEGGGEPGICAQADRTVITALGSNGRALSGWPRAVDGVGLQPVVATDGTVYLAGGEVGEVTGPVSVIAIDRSGTTKDGWPMIVPEVSSGCPERELGLAVSPDGRAFLMLNGRTASNEGQGVIIVLNSAGSRASGWQIPGMGLDTGCAGCTPGSPPLAPLFAADGTTYVLVGPGDMVPSTQVLAFDRQGRVVAGWPHLVSTTGTTQVGISLGLDGRLYVILEVHPDGAYDQPTATLRLYVLGADGRPVSG